MLFTESNKVIMGCSPAALTGAAGDGRFVSLSNFARLSVIVSVDNATTVTGGAVTLVQATNVAGSGAKGLAFSTGQVLGNLDTSASDAFTAVTVTSSGTDAATFTTTAVNNANSLYTIEVDASDLDVANGFDCVRVDVANMANAVGSVVYILTNPRYSPASDMTAIVD